MTIVVGWVPTPEGDAALERAVAEARLRDERLVVLNASSGASYADARYASEEQLRGLRERLDASGVDVELRQSLGRQPSEEVVETAAETGASLVVIGLRHRTSVGKFLLGSSAQEILMASHCPVLAVPAPRSRS